MEKGRLRTPELLAWASGRAAEGLLQCCLQARRADHPEPCSEAQPAAWRSLPTPAGEHR